MTNIMNASSNPIPHDEQKVIRLLDGVRTVMEKVVRILSGRRPRVIYSDDEWAPGWTDGQDIYLSRPRMVDAIVTGTLDDLVMLLKAVIYHELSHILYTPRNDSLPTSTVIQGVMNLRGTGDFDDSQHYWYSFNGLEDQRIETWFTAKYQPAGRFFEAAALEWLVSTPEALEMAHVLVHGRRYLPAEVRRRAREAFTAKHGVSFTKEFTEVIDKYVMLQLPKDSQEALILIDRYYRLLRRIVPSPRDLPPQPSEDNDPRQKDHAPTRGGAGEEQFSQGDPEPEKEQDRAKQDVERQQPDDDEAIDNAEDVEDSGGEGDGDGGNTDDDTDAEVGSDSDSDDEGDEDDGSSGSATGDGDESDDAGADGDTGQDGETAADSDGESNRTNQSGGDGIGQGNPTDDLLEAAERAIEDALSDDDFNDDVQQTAKSIDAVAEDSDGMADKVAPNRPSNHIPQENRDAVRRIVTALSPLRLDMEPERHRRQTTGRVDFQRLINRNPWEMDIFQQWDEGSEDDGGIEVVVAIDVSGSMTNLMVSASAMLWSIKSAFDRMEIRTTVLGYSDDWFVFYRPGEKAEKSSIRMYDAQMGTLPHGALRQAYDILTMSESRNRVLVSITDGGWGGDVGKAEAIIRELQSKHQTTGLLIGLEGAVSGHGDHGHKVAQDVADVTEVPMVVGKLVKEVQRTAINPT